MRDYFAAISAIHRVSHSQMSLLDWNCPSQDDARPVVADENLLSSLSRKRKISKIWDSICGHVTADPTYLGTQMCQIGRLPDDNNRQPHKEQRKDSTTKMANWRVGVDIDAGLAADFDDSLSGLGVEIGTESYNMSEALLALPQLPVFKQEVTENGPVWDEEMESEQNHKFWEPSQNGSCMVSEDDSEGYWSVCSEHGAITSEEMGPNGAIYFKTRCRQVTTSTPHTPTVNTNVVSSPHLLHNVPSYPVNNSILAQNRFQYVLGAATSIATKMHEETLTYLNQGQSYEIKLKKLGDLTEFRGKLLKSIVRVSFHERRLQYTEKEQIQNWRQTRPNERILEIDIPLSYGICEVVQDQIHLNACEFVWDPTKETGVFIRVNCVSTEFTPKKHGGEKGVPFRIQIETFTHSDGPPQRLHCASCQVKVFKPKGADRKHKTDREKMEKRTNAEQDKFQPSFDCTVLTECTLDTIYTSPAPPPPSTVSISSTISQKNNESFHYSPSPDNRLPPGTPTSMTADSPVGDQTNDSMDNPVLDYMQMIQQPLMSEASVSQACQWLHANRFGQYVRLLSGFSGADILRLNRDDLIQICGVADGIRLYNTRTLRPRLTIYVCLDPEQVYHAIYLSNLTVDEMLGKFANILSITPQQIHDIFIQGPSGIHIHVADEVIQNIPQESMFAIEIIKDQTSEFYHLLLKTTNSH